jgi:cytochrome c553
MNKLLTTMFGLAVASVTAFSTLPAQAQEVKGNAAAGEKKIAMCIGCHGIQGYQASFPEVYKVPMISGQSAKYIVAALAAYKTGDRKHPTMRGIADSLSDQDMADIALYYEATARPTPRCRPSRPNSPAPRSTALLKKAACASCHGDNFAKPIDPAYPKIAGQHADYLFVALKAYKTEGNATLGRSNGVMAGIAKQFSNAELKALSGYIGSLEGDLKTVPEKKFR